MVLVSVLLSLICFRSVVEVNYADRKIYTNYHKFHERFFVRKLKFRAYKLNKKADKL